MYFLHFSTITFLYSTFASGIIIAVKGKEAATLFKFSSLKVHLIQRFNSSGMLHYIWKQGCSLWTFLNLKMKTLQSFETSVTIYNSPGHNISEDLNLKQHHYEDLKSYIWPIMVPESQAESSWKSSMYFFNFSCFNVQYLQFCL